MTISINENSTVLGHWFTTVPGGDWLAAIWRDNDESLWNIKYRFRWIRDDKIFDSEDEKSWYTVTPTEDSTDAELFEMMDDLAKTIASVSHAKLDRTVGPITGAQFIETLKRKEYANMAQAN